MERPRGNTLLLAPGRPGEQDNDRDAPTQLRLACTRGKHGTHETKTQTERSQSPGVEGRTSRTNSPKPPMELLVITVS